MSASASLATMSDSSRLMSAATPTSPPPNASASAATSLLYGMAAVR